MSCKGAKTMPCECLSVSRFGLKNESNLDEALSLNIIRME